MLFRSDARHAAGVFLDVRDLFLADAAHWVVCGTTEIDRLILRATPQVDGIFPAALELAPLSAADVADLLRRRYTAMRRGTATVIPPITPEDGATLYGLYHGNLRSFLKLLQDAVLAGAGPGGARSLTTDRVLALMGRQHLRAVTEDMGTTAWRYLVTTVLGPTPSAPLWGAFRQVDAAARTGRKAPVIKPHFDAWIETGAITALNAPPAGHETGGRGEWYRVSGHAATALAALALNDGRDVRPLIDGTVGSTSAETLLSAAENAPAPQGLRAPARGRKRS